MEESEVKLIRRCQTGDKDAFGAIVKRYAGAARGAAVLILGSYEDALDASQEAFVRAWRHIRTFDTEAPFYPWYAAILRNVCISKMRRRSGRRTVELVDGQARSSADSDPILLAERNERRDRIWRAIQALSPPHREIIVMNHFQGLSYKEIAAALDIPIGTVMSRLHAARQVLKSSLSDEEE